MHADGVNRRYLPDCVLPANIEVSAKLEDAVADAELIIVAVPTSGLRDMLRMLSKIRATRPLLWLCKGFEAGSMLLPHQVVAESWPAGQPVGTLSGPSFAREVAAGLPTALTVAAFDAAFARQIAHALRAPHLRLYSSDDLIGVEVGGAVKNVIAIAAGISDGLGFGHNARAALITRGLAEIARLGLRLGGRPDTFMGLSGMGDLLLTCTGDLSRNRQVGLRLAHGESLEGILRALKHVAEGVTTACEINRLAQELEVDMPISRAVYRILVQDLTPREAVATLFERELKDESEPFAQSPAALDRPSPRATGGALRGEAGQAR